MHTILRFCSGVGLGLIIALWVPLFLPAGFSIPIVQYPPSEQSRAQTSETAPILVEATPPKIKAKITVAETLHTGDPKKSDKEPEPISGQLPRNLRFSWKDDPASGLAPGFLWVKGDSYQLGTQRVAPQDGDIRKAYAFEAPGVLPDEYAGRLIFHKKLLNRLLRWSNGLEEVADDTPLVVSVERVNSRTIRLLLPAINSKPATQLTVTL